MLVEVNHSREFRWLQMDTGFVTSKKQQQVHHSRWQSFQFRFNSSAEIVCNQSNFDQKMFAISRFFSLCDSSANPNCFEPSVFFSDCRLGSNLCSGGYCWQTICYCCYGEPWSYKWVRRWSSRTRRVPSQRESTPSRRCWLRCDMSSSVDDWNRRNCLSVLLTYFFYC